MTSYGYTSASFSGRMPCIDIADAIVQTARITLERAISMVNNTPAWAAEVVYGDTDSLFVRVRGASKQRAFVVAQEIASAVTRSNPAPVTLKVEKVYHPAMLVSKKRYTGLLFESATESHGRLEVKGLEIIRRDSCPLVQRVMREVPRYLPNLLSY